MFKRILSLILCFTLFATLGIPVSAVTTEETEVIPEGETFKSHFINLGGDPWVTYHDGWYYYMVTGNGFYVAKSRELERVNSNPVSVFNMSDLKDGENFSIVKELWAPELHFIDGFWYIYFTAYDGETVDSSASNGCTGTAKNHRMYVLKSKTDDAQGEYEFMGQIKEELSDYENDDKWQNATYNIKPGHFAIDQTVFKWNGKLYAAWSGWSGYENIDQRIYIAEMSDPCTISGKRVELSRPELAYETYSVSPAINEGPQALISPDGKTLNIAFSVNLFTSSHYSLGLLTLKENGNPLNTEDWTKSQEPLFETSIENSTYSVGHCSFVPSPDKSEYYVIYHARRGEDTNANPREIRTQQFYWNTDGTPSFDDALSAADLVPVPSGTADLNRTEIEAETAELAGGAIVINPTHSTTTYDDDYYSGGKRISLVGSGRTATFKYNAETQGKYTITLMASGSDSTKSGLCVTVNGKEYYRQINGNMNNLNIFGYYDINGVELVEGENTIVVSHSSKYTSGAYLDRLDITNEAYAESAQALQDEKNLTTDKKTIFREKEKKTIKYPVYNKEYTFDNFSDFDKYWFSSQPFVDDPEYQNVITTCRAGGNKRLLVTGEEFKNLRNFKTSVEVIPAAAHENSLNPDIDVADEKSINAGILFRIGKMYDYTSNICTFDGYRCMLIASNGVVKMQIHRYYFADSSTTKATPKELITATDTIPYTPGDTYVIELTCVGNRVDAVAYNTKDINTKIEIVNQTIETSVAETINSGRIGLFVNCGSRVTFANMKVTSFDINETTTNSYENITDFVVKSNIPSQKPIQTDNGIVTSIGALKMQSLDYAVSYKEKTFCDLYNIANYDIYGNKIHTTDNKVSTYGNAFDITNNIITTADAQSKLKLDGTEGMTDFTTEFTITKIGSNSLYGGIAFRINDSDFRTGTFGTQGYMLYVTSAATSKNVKIVLRKYSTATIKEENSVTATALLGTATNGVTVKVTVSGDALNVTISDAENLNSTFSHNFSLIPTTANGTYYDSGSFAFVSNGNHTIENITLKGEIPTNYTTHEKEIHNLYDRDYYTIFGNTTGNDVTDYGVTFTDNRISAYAQSKVKINGYSNVEDFRAGFDLKKTNGNALYGGIAFRIQDGFFTKAPYGTPGYMLYAYSDASSMDLSLRLRNYSTASSFASKEIIFEGFLAAPNQKNIRIEVEVIGDTLNATVYDLTDLSRKNSATFDLSSTDAKAGNFKGGSIAFVANGTHDFSNISVSEFVYEAPYTQVENFEASADFRFPSSNTIQAGIMFYVQDTCYKAAGLTAFSLNAIRTSNSKDKAMTLQLVRYGMKKDGTQNVNIGAVSGSTNEVINILENADGAGETVRLKITATRGTLYYSLQNLVTGKTSDVYAITLNTSSTSSSVDYKAAYSNGGIGIFTNLQNVNVSNFKVTNLSDCTVNIPDTIGGVTTGENTYAYGENITVTATPEYGYYFGGWYNGDMLLSTDTEYSFTVTENITLFPSFLAFPLKYSGLDTTNTAVIITTESLEGVSEIGVEVEIKSENSEESFTLSTEYINPETENQNAFIAVKDKVYYCDLNSDGTANSADLVSLRKGLIIDNLASKNADLNDDGKTDILDLVRFKRISADVKLQFEDTYTGYIYPFVVADKLNDTEIQYIEIKPYSIIDGIKAYTAPRYFKYEGKKLVSDSASANHTPFGKIRIACVGDSLTQGVGATGWASGDYTYAYPEQLAEILGDSCTVANFGVGGSYAYYYDGRTKSKWYPNTERYTLSTEFDADIVLLMMGTNDASVVGNEEKSEAFKTAYIDLVNRYLDAEHKPIIYVMNGLSMKNYDIKQSATNSNWIYRDPNFVNYIIPKHIEVKNELGLNFIDTYNGTLELMETTSDGLASDMLHPNDVGYRAIAELVANSISLDIFY